MLTLKTKLLSVIIIIGTLGFNIVANAQIKYGPVVGINFASLSGAGSNLVSTRIGYSFGGKIEFLIKDKFLIEPGLLYSLKGAQDTVDGKKKLNLKYFEIPVNAKIKFESGINIFAGPYLGILSSATFTDSTVSKDAKDLLISSDFGLNFGIGFDSKMGLGLSLQYGLGLSNINSDTRVSNSNNVIGLSLKFMFGDNNNTSKNQDGTKKNNNEQRSEDNNKNSGNQTTLKQEINNNNSKSPDNIELYGLGKNTFSFNITRLAVDEINISIEHFLNSRRSIEVNGGLIYANSFLRDEVKSWKNFSVFLEHGYAFRAYYKIYKRQEKVSKWHDYIAFGVTYIHRYYNDFSIDTNGAEVKQDYFGHRYQEEFLRDEKRDKIGIEFLWGNVYEASNLFAFEFYYGAGITTNNASRTDHNRYPVYLEQIHQSSSTSIPSVTDHSFYIRPTLQLGFKLMLRR